MQSCRRIEIFRGQIKRGDSRSPAPGFERRIMELNHEWRSPKYFADGFPLHALTQRPMHMYHSWGTHNAWLRQLQARNPLFVHHKTAAQMNLADGDWVWFAATR